MSTDRRDPGGGARHVYHGRRRRTLVRLVVAGGLVAAVVFVAVAWAQLGAEHKAAPIPVGSRSPVPRRSSISRRALKRT